MNPCQGLALFGSFLKDPAPVALLILYNTLTHHAFLYYNQDWKSCVQNQYFTDEE